MRIAKLGPAALALTLAAGGASAAPADAKPAAATAAKPAIALGVTPDDKLGTAPPGLGLKVGEKAPNVTLDDAAGGKKSIADLASAGPLYVVFYRGGWCPFCNLQMRELAKAKPELSARGVGLVAISVDTPTQEAKVQAQHEAAFPFLSDPDLVAHKAFNVVHVAGAEEQKALAGYGINLSSYSGKDHHSFAAPAVFLIDRKGVIRFAHVSEDYKTRPSTAQLLGVVDRMKGKL
jgi:peroxiredoxin